MIRHRTTFFAAALIGLGMVGSSPLWSAAPGLLAGLPPSSSGQASIDAPQGQVSIDAPAGQASIDASAGQTSIDASQGQASLRSPSIERSSPPDAARVLLPYREDAVTFQNGPVTLAGTLTVPSGIDRPPVLLLVSCSGPQNRDASMLGMTPFRTLADHLGRRGFAVLRYDDRGVGQSTGNFAAATTVDFAQDAEAGVAFLRTRRDIDPARIGVLGHSEGGLIAPMVAARNPDVAFVVLMAGPGLPGEEIVREQTRRMSEASGLTGGEIAFNDGVLTRAFGLLREGKPLSSLQADFLAMSRSGFSVMSEAERAQIGSPERLAWQQMKSYDTPWFRFFITHDPAEVLREVHCPVLAIGGSLDLQVPASANLPAIRRALEAGGNHQVKTLELPGLNHLFQKARTGSPAEYPALAKELAPEMLEATSSWLQERTSRS